MAGPRRQVTDEDILRAIALHPEPVVSSGDLTDDLDVTRQAINKRLNDLVERGLLNSKQVGSAAKVYWFTDAGRNELPDV